VGVYNIRQEGERKPARRKKEPSTHRRQLVVSSKGINDFKGIPAEDPGKKGGKKTTTTNLERFGEGGRVRRQSVQSCSGGAVHILQDPSLTGE